MKPYSIFLAAALTCLAVQAEAKLYVSEPDAACANVGQAIPGENRIISGSIDNNLFSEVVRAQVNELRCRRGKSVLRGYAPLRQLSEDQSAWMAEAAKLSYRTEMPGRTSVRDRLSSLKVPFKSGRESILRLPGVQAAPGLAYKVSRTRCIQEADDGSSLPKQTYASLAGRALALLMENDRHRANILNEKNTHMSAGAGTSFATTACGTHYVAIHFVEMRQQVGDLPSFLHWK